MAFTFDAVGTRVSMNPFTRQLALRSSDPEWLEFVTYWDRLEDLVMAVHKRGIARLDDEEEFRQVWPWLLQRYGHFGKKLLPYWKQAKLAGKPAREDPYLRLLALNRAADAVDNWSAMQTLPVAREALNRFLLEQS